MNSTNWRAFLAGSAYPTVFFPFALLSISSLARPESGFQMEFVVWFFPLTMGLWNILFIKIRKFLPGKPTTHYWLWGLLLGIIFPVIGNLNGVPGTLWGLHFPQGLFVIPLAMCAYALVWRYAVSSMNRLLQIDHTHDS